MSKPQFSGILNSLHPDLLIYDLNQPWAADMASSQDIPAVQFINVSASFVSFCLYTTKNVGKHFRYPEIYLREHEELFKLQGRGNDVNRGGKFLEAVDPREMLLIRSCREIEGKYMDFLSVASGKKVVPVGPLLQDFNAAAVDDDDDTEDEDKEIIELLDQKEKGSVVYASFGSEYFLTKEEIEAISKGLELSNVDFMWVVRFPLMEEKISLEEALPGGFLDRIGNRGKLVIKWAPQVKILKHSGVGAFVSHCGWNSVRESLRWGVPIVAMPMHIDQPLNARVVDAVGIGVEAVRNDQGNLLSEEIAKAIRKVLVEESGEEARRKAKELSVILGMKSDGEMDRLTEELLGLCRRNYNEQR